MKTYKWHGDEWHNKDEWSDIEGENMREAAKNVCNELHKMDPDVNEIDLIVATPDLATKKRYIVSKDHYVLFSALEIPSQ